MSTNERTAVKATAMIFALLSFIACTPEEESDADTDSPGAGSVTLVELDAPLRSPLYATIAESLFAIQADGSRLVKLDTGDGPVETVSEQLEGAGENLAFNPAEAGRLYVPQPEVGRIRVVGAEEMQEMRIFGAGVPPARVTLEPRGAGTLFVLSDSGRTLTAVDLADHQVVAEAEVGIREATLLDTYRGFDDFRVWVAGPRGVALHDGPSLEPRATAQIEAASLAVGTGGVVRAYVGETGSGRVLAVEPAPDGGLEVVASRDLGTEARYLEPEEDRLYAATDDELVVLDGDALKPIASVDLGPALHKKSIAEANLSGLAVGKEHVYLTLERKPYVLLVEKP